MQHLYYLYASIVLLLIIIYKIYKNRMISFKMKTSFLKTEYLYNRKLFFFKFIRDIPIINKNT